MVEAGRAMINIEHLRLELDTWDTCKTECDGQTRVILTLLFRKNIAHQIWRGCLAWIGLGELALLDVLTMRYANVSGNKLLC